MSFEHLKRSSSQRLKQIQTNIQNDNAKRSYADPRYWSPVVDKNGGGSAVIRFLPGIAVVDPNDPNYNTAYIQALIKSQTVPDEPLCEPSYVKMWKHGFKDPTTGQWYIENNRNSLGTDDDRVTDPCTDYNASLWKTGEAAHMDQARRQKRKLIYISNILVVKHPSRPEDQGKVFLYGYGKKIFEKIEAVVGGDSTAGVPPVDVFNMWDGANFHLKLANVGGFRNYDQSNFLIPGPVDANESVMAEIYGKEYSLFDEVALDKFKSYDELRKQLHRALGLKEDGEEEPPRAQPRSRPTAAAPPPKAHVDEEPPFDVDDDGVITDRVAVTSPDAKAYFKTLSVKA